jgi:enterochelin esterase-like enzyme
MRHRRRRAETEGEPHARIALRRTAAALWLVVLFVLGVAAQVNRYVGYVPSLRALGGQLIGDPGRGVAHSDPNAAGSRILKVEIPGASAGLGQLGAYVYLPPGYDEPANARIRYPVLYLIHGSPGWPVDWFRAARAGTAMDDLLVHRVVRPMIVVAPTANRRFLDDSECLDAVPRPLMETYLTRDVVDFVDHHYRTVADRRGRGIGGISAGGFCAMNLGLRHQREFSVVLAHMPYGDPGPEREITSRLLGGQTILYQENSPRVYLRTLTFHAPIAFFIDVGSKDAEVLRQATTLEQLLTMQRQLVDFRIVPGESHTWRLGRDELPYSLTFASQQFDRTMGPIVTATRPAADEP